jgi:hypothetical protein
MDRLVTTSDEDGVPLNKNFMRRVFGGSDQWNDSRKALIDGGHMSVLKGGSYEVGSDSKHYALGERWSEAGTARVECRNAALLERLHSWEKSRPSREGWLPVHFWLAGMLRTFRLDFKMISPDIRNSRHVQWIIEALLAAWPRASVCDYGRFHSPVTRMRRDLRRALRVKGRKLVELDVACSQPLLLSNLAGCDSTGRFAITEQLTYGAKYKPSKINASQPPANNHRTHSPSAFDTILCPSISTHSNASTYADSLIDEPDVPGDLARFTLICERGNVYEHFAELWGWDMTGPERRNQLKGLVFRTLLFGRIPRNDHWDNYTQWIQFTEKYPSLARYLRGMKRKDHGTVARVAQRVESWLILERICGRIMNEIPDAIIATIHDSILVEQSFAQGVTAIMREEFASIGLNPTIRSK